MTFVSSQDNNAESLELTLMKIQAINTVNAESLHFIQSRKGQQVITQRKYYLENKQPAKKSKAKAKQNASCSNNVEQQHHIGLACYNSSKDVDIVIKSWKYIGESLTKEPISFDVFIDTSLKSFHDLIRLQADYERLTDKYSRVLKDQLESRVAVSILMSNVEILQVAIGDIHSQTIDVNDCVGGKAGIESSVELVAKELEKLQSFGINLRLNLNVSTQKEEKVIVPEFDDCNDLYCKDTLAEHDFTVSCLESYIVEGTQYLVSASYDYTIKLWNMNDHSSIATLSGHSYAVRSLSPYNQNNVPMLASGSADRTIKIWNLSTNQAIETLTGHTNAVCSLVTYIKEGNLYLASGSRDETVRLWDLDSYSHIKTLECGIGAIHSMKVFYLNYKPYLVIAACEGLTIWCLTHNMEVTKLGEEKLEYHSIAIINHEHTKILACGTSTGQIDLFNLENKRSIGTFSLHHKDIRALEWIRCDGDLCLVSGSDDCSVKVWNLTSRSVISTLQTHSCVYAIRAITKEGYASLLSAHGDREIKVWEA